MSNRKQTAENLDSSKGIAKPLVMRHFSTSLVWYHRSEEMPHEGNRIIVYSPCYDDKDPMKLRIIDSQFYGISKDGWQTMRYARKARKWDILAQEKMKLLQQIEEYETR